MTKRDRISRELENNYRGIKHDHDLCADRILKICEPDREIIAEALFRALTIPPTNMCLNRYCHYVADEIIKECEK